MPNIKVAPIVDAETATAQLDAAMSEKIDELVQAKFAKYLNEKIETTIASRLAMGNWSMSTESYRLIRDSVIENIESEVINGLSYSEYFLRNVASYVEHPDIDYEELGKHLLKKDEEIATASVTAMLMNSTRFRNMVYIGLETEVKKALSNDNDESLIHNAIVRSVPEVASLVMRQISAALNRRSDV